MADWIIVNLETRKLADFDTEIVHQPDGNYGHKFVISIEHSLTVMDTNKIIRQANLVWNPGKPPSPPRFVTDASCDVILLDHDDVLVDQGGICPDTQLVNLIEDIETPGLKVP